MSSGQRRISPEAFKREAVAGVLTSGLPPSKVASELGLHETVLLTCPRKTEPVEAGVSLVL